MESFGNNPDNNTSSIKQYEKVIAYVFELVKTGELGLKEKLPGEREIAKILDISRSSVREAISYLSSAQILQVVRGKGTFLNSNVMQLGLNAKGQPFGSAPADLMHLLEVRFMFEPETARLAALRDDGTCAAELSQIFESMKFQLENGALAIEEDYKFHLAIAKGSKNPVAYNTFLSLEQTFRSVLVYGRTTAEVAQMPRHGIIEHRRIMDAISSREPYEARAAMLDHLEDIRKRYVCRSE